MASFLEGINRQYDVGNERFTQEKLELVTQLCTVIRDCLITATSAQPLSEDDQCIVLKYQDAMEQLIGELRRILLR